jgi:general secretion pathway protein C
MLMGWWAFANVMPMFEEKKEIVASVKVVNKAPSTKKPSLNTLNLFGSAEKNAAINKTSEAKQTKLSLTLRGVLATDDPKQGIAQIQNAKKQERHFAVSDSVFGQATLEEIHADHVILLHNGRYETLVLPEKFLNVKHFSAELHARDKKKIATDYRKLFLSRDGETMRKLFGFDTAWKNGGFAGFIVKALSEKGREMMATFGVEDGDLITVVNGLRFSESLEATQQLIELKTATSVDIIIERDGQEFPLHIAFNAPLEDIADVSGNSTPPANINNQDSNSTQDNTFTNGFDNSRTSSSTGNNNNSPSTGSIVGSSPHSAGSKTTKKRAPSIPFDEKPEAEEFKRMQRERTTGNNAPVEYDH